MQDRPSEDPVSLAFAMSSRPSPPPSGFLSSKAGCASLAVHQFHLVMGVAGLRRCGLRLCCSAAQPACALH